MPGSKPIYVLGVGLSHNGAACLLEDGRIKVAIEKERITKIKGDGGNDQFAIEYCLSAAGIRSSDLDLIVQNANFGRFAYGNQWYHGQRRLPAGVKVVTISHHLAHAYSAFYLSPFEEAAILIVDGCGSAYEDCVDLDDARLALRPEGDFAALTFEKDSYYIADDKGLSAFYKDFSPWGRLSSCDYPMHPTTTRHSIGGLYAAASKYMFPRDTDLGKLMGLAPYGRPGQYDIEIFSIQDGRVFVNYDWIENFTDRVRSDKDFTNRFQYFADIAWLAQREVERALLALIEARYAARPSENLCFAGGVALNAVANSRIARESPFKRVFVPPAADDSGIALGCAYYGWQKLLGRERVRHDGSPFLGQSYALSEIELALATAGNGVIIQTPEDLTGAMAEILCSGKTLAWFRDGAEFGPRALGHRSILGDPRRPELRDYINAKVKFREDFRPFAPAVLAEEASRYFDLTMDSPYMLFVVPVREEWRTKIGAVVHVDGTARVQTVQRDADPVFHDLLTRFKRYTEVGVLLNTSLNRRGQPIVETPDEAVALLLESGLHGLAIGPYLVMKKE